jgi:hypothetical protein
MACNAVCHIYSGRPDPGWKLTKKQAKEVDRIWQSLKETSVRDEFPSFLGYRGILLVWEDGREIFVFNKRAKGKIKNRILWKSDEVGRLERYLLSSAPEGVLPAELLNNLLS